MSDRYVLETRRIAVGRAARRRLFHRIASDQTAPPFTSRCGRRFLVSATALADAPGDGVECGHCTRVAAFQASRSDPR